MPNFLTRYAQWLHTQWPAGVVERLPEVRADGSTRVPGMFVVGDLTGIPLLKFAADSGARAVQTILAAPGFRRSDGDRAASRGPQAPDEAYDLVIIGAGVAGMAAALEARRVGLRFALLEASEAFATITNFPRRKPIYTYPHDMTPAGELQVSADVKESLLAELRRQTIERGIQPQIATAERVERRGDELLVVLKETRPLRARSVIVAIGRSGNFRKLGVPGESLDKVANRLHDPRDFIGQDVLVVGGGDSALEAAIALAESGARVTLSYRKSELSRPKPENLERLAALSPRVQMRLGTTVREITETHVVLRSAAGGDETIPNQAVFAMLGREAPLEFFRRSGVPIAGELRAANWLALSAFLLFCIFLYHWKTTASELPLYALFAERGWFPFNVPALFSAAGGVLAAAADTPGHLLHVLRGALAGPSFYYTLAYCLCVVIFGLRRIRRRRTPYVRLQTYTLMAIQVVPLFLLPEILLPWAGQNGWFDGGAGGWIASQFWPHGEYWRAYGLVLAWPLFIWNVFTQQPLWAWLVLSFVQTFVLIPLLVWRWGKGAYCGWICSCGALAETLGDAHRQKMPHGPAWNRLNLVGQVVLVFAAILLLLRIIAWTLPGGPVGGVFAALLSGVPFLNYRWIVDIMMAGVIGVGCYFWFSGRVWCRFACPLAALMHIYARFSRFRIFADKKKCISCNVCTSVCHQGIDVMNFANKGRAMEDPQCVRCSACVQSCPTGVLRFGRLTLHGQPVHDRISASPLAP